jgi:hypothetical protein
MIAYPSLPPNFYACALFALAAGVLISGRTPFAYKVAEVRMALRSALSKSRL